MKASRPQNKKKKIVTLKRLKNWSLTLIGLVLIILAISFTLVRVAIKSMPDYSAAIQQEVSKQIGMTLKVGLLDAEISWLVPRLNLFDVNVYDDKGKHHLLHLDEIDLSLDWSESLKNLTLVIGEITLVGLDIQMGVNEKSQLYIQNFLLSENVNKNLNATPQQQVRLAIDETIKNNFNTLDFKVIKSKVRLYDYRNGRKSRTFSDVNLHLINNGEFHVFEVKAELPKKHGKSVHFIVEAKGDLFDYGNLQGSLYLSVEDVQLAPWLDDYWNELKTTANARVNGSVWLDWNGSEVKNVHSRLDLSDIAIHYLDKNVNTWNVKKIDASIHWKKEKDDWQLDIRDMMVEREGIEWLDPAAVTIKVKNSENIIEMQADFLRIKGFAYLVGMIKNSIDMDVEWMNLLEKHKPSGVLRNVDVFLPMDHLQDIRINTEFSQVGLSLPGFEPSAIRNIQGSIAYLDKTTWLILDTVDATVEFDKLFRNEIYLKDLKGVLEISHKNHVWKLISNTLNVNTPHIETQSRINFSMPDNGRAFVDLTTSYKNGKAKFINRYLPAGVMGENAVEWIDDALLSGEVTEGGYLFYGCLDDLPFEGHQGVSLAEFNVEKIDLNYLQDWPDITGISANLRFENDAMFIKAHKGRMYNSDIKNVDVYIDNFVTPTLDVKARIDTNLKNIKTFVKESPLRDDVTTYIDNLQFTGKGDLNLELFLPLYGDFNTEVGGELVVKNAGISFTNEKYELHRINGLIRFAGDNVESSGLTAEIKGNGKNKKLDVNVTTKLLDSGHSYFIGLQGNVLAPLLLIPVPQIQDKLSGSADWDIGIKIDSKKNSTSVDVLVKSDLEGVTSLFPGPLKKSAQDVEPIEFKIRISSENNDHYSIKRHNGDTLDFIKFRDKIEVVVDAKSVKGVVKINTQDDIEIPVVVNLEYLDLNDFVSTEDKGEKKVTESSSELLPIDVPSMQLSAEKILWKKSIYKENSLDIQHSKVGAVIKQFKFIGNGHEITGKGSWYTGRGGSGDTRLDINLRADNLGKTFSEYGIEDSLIGAEGNVNVRWQWPGAPYDFDWDVLKGDGELRFNDGTFQSINAGAGRLLGLFNFKTLLSLDFGSQVKDGFHFDKLYGSFSFGKGNIYSDDFTIESKVADITMQGQLSFSRNTIKQKVIVHPHLGGTVTLGAAVVAGPTIGGIVYLFQKIFNTDKLSEYQYTMSGNLDDPKVELISAPETEQELSDDEDI